MDRLPTQCDAVRSVVGRDWGLSFFVVSPLGFVFTIREARGPILWDREVNEGVSKEVTSQVKGDPEFTQTRTSYCGRMKGGVGETRKVSLHEREKEGQEW